MITNTPAVAQTSGNRKGSKAEEMPFEFKGTPFGGLLNSPDLRQFFKNFGSMPQMPGRGMPSAGSGVIVDPSGIILTNNHVVAGGGQVMVRLHDGREFKAVDIKTDPKSDLAILRIEGAGTLPAAWLGDSNKVEVGDWVLALGEPFGLEGTVTAGIISAKGRGIGITDREDFIQTDAAINPGNSGGPLVNLDGEVIGINTAISSNSGGYFAGHPVVNPRELQGAVEEVKIGSAEPLLILRDGKQLTINVICREMPRESAMSGGNSENPGKQEPSRFDQLGIQVENLTPELADHGVAITDVRTGSPADLAGLATGMVITELSDTVAALPTKELAGRIARNYGTLNVRNDVEVRPNDER
jgi:S1-C subfamily serine protease